VDTCFPHSGHAIKDITLRTRLSDNDFGRVHYDYRMLYDDFLMTSVASVPADMVAFALGDKAARGAEECDNAGQN